MSYILDALRRSEQEREPQKVPDLGTYHRHIETQPKSKFPYWFIGISLLLVNIIYVIYQMNREPESVTLASPAVIDSASMNSAIINETREQILPPSLSVSAVETEVENMPVPESPVPELNSMQIIEKSISGESRISPNIQPQTVLNTQPNNLDRIVAKDIADLSINLQNKIPSMEFSTHIYISDGGSFIIINGKNLSNGMFIERGLRVHQITADGVILDFQGQRFFLASMTDWQQY